MRRPNPMKKMHLQQLFQNIFAESLLAPRISSQGSPSARPPSCTLWSVIFYAMGYGRRTMLHKIPLMYHLWGRHKPISGRRTLTTLFSLWGDILLPGLRTPMATRPKTGATPYGGRLFLPPSTFRGHILSFG